MKRNIFYFLVFYLMMISMLFSFNLLEVSAGTQPGNIEGIKVTHLDYTWVTFAWDKDANSKSYDIYQWSSEENKFLKIANTASTFYTVGYLHEGWTYTFRVKGVNGNNISKTYTNQVQPTMKECFPDRVTGLIAQAHTYKSIKLTWNKDLKAKFYKIYQLADDGTWKNIKNTSDTSTIIDNLKEEKKYSFKLKAVGNHANCNRESKQFSEWVSSYTKKCILTPDSNYALGEERHGRTKAQASGYYHSDLINSYLEVLGKTATDAHPRYVHLNKGTYILPVSIKIPSNVHVILDEDAVLVKAKQQGSHIYNSSVIDQAIGNGVSIDDKKDVKYDFSIIEFVEPSVAYNYEAVGGYNSVHNASITGGTINLNEAKMCEGIVIAHNQNISISNIKFTHSKAHFVELVASKNIFFTNCSFMNKGIDNYNMPTEAINIDNPDLDMYGFPYKFSKFDKQGNDNIHIEDCIFKGPEDTMYQAIASHSFSIEKKDDGSIINYPHNNFVIANNVFYNISGKGPSILQMGAIATYNWNNAVIRDNKFINTSVNKEGTCAIKLTCSANISILNNSFEGYNDNVLKKDRLDNSVKKIIRNQKEEDYVAFLSRNYPKFLKEGRTMKYSIEPIWETSYDMNGINIFD
ncbi:MAG: hypothetical protein HFG31_04725 [Eubacterium sp.]|nr:hypothetical protein [Eubacterium sp.]